MRGSSSLGFGSTVVSEIGSVIFKSCCSVASRLPTDMDGWSFALLGGGALWSGLVLQKGRTSNISRSRCVGIRGRGGCWTGCGSGDGQTYFAIGFRSAAISDGEGGCRTGSGSGDGRTSFATSSVSAGIGDGGEVCRIGALHAGTDHRAREGFLEAGSLAGG